MLSSKRSRTATSDDLSATRQNHHVLKRGVALATDVIGNNQRKTVSAWPERGVHGDEGLVGRDRLFEFKFGHMIYSFETRVHV